MHQDSLQHALQGRSGHALQVHAPLLLHNAPHTPGRSDPPEFLTPQRQPPQAAQLSCFSSQTLLPHGMYNSLTHSHDQQTSACPLPQLSRIGLAGPALSQAEEACLLQLGAQPMSQECPLSSRQLSAQLPAQQPTQLPVSPSTQTRDPRPLSPILGHASPVSSGQFPTQPPAKAPMQVAKSRDPRRPAHHASAVTPLVANPTSVANPEPISPTSPTQSALFATFLMLDSPDATSSVLHPGDALMNTGDALMMASSPARWHSPEPQAMTPHLQGPHLSESTLAPLDALLNSHRDFVISDQSDDFGFGMDDSGERSTDSVLLNEAIQAAEQHSQQAQRDSVSPPQLRAVSETSEGISQAQSLALLAPSSSLESQNFSLPKSQTLFRLLQQSESNDSFPSASKGCNNPLKRRWPETQPYTICRWWFLVMQ